jgi:hypothetical protein
MRKVRTDAVLFALVVAAWGTIELARAVDRQRLAERQAEYEMVEQRRRINRALEQAIPVQDPAPRRDQPRPAPRPGQRDA